MFFFMQKHLPGPEKLFENEADRTSAQTSPEGPDKC